MKRIMISFLLFFIAFNLNAQAPAGYYDAANGKTGYQLKTALKEIITNGHTDQGYDALFSLYQNSDVDNYYENDGTLLDMYSENPAGADAYEYNQTGDKCGTYSAEGDCYNREHIMPQSAFNSAAPMKDDGHFVVPADGYVNNRRGNYPFGEVSNPSWTSTNGSKIGPNTTPGYSGTVFEPIDEFKGDIARMLFYVATRYEDEIASWNSDMLNGTSDQVFADWFLDILRQWHADDPVSQREIDRNEAVYNYQGNRNPFIDHPEWVEEIWGRSDQQTNATVIAIQDFDGTTPEWSYTEHDGGYNCFNIAANYQNNSTNSLQIKGTNNHNADPYIELANIDISSYNNVKLWVYFAAHGPDGQDDLYVDYSYDNGTSWTSVKLVDGYSNADINFGDTNASDPTTVSPNPYSIDIPDSETQIKVRIRFDERSSKNNTSDYYYVDNIKLEGQSTSSTDTPDWCNLQWPPDGNVRSGDGFTVYAQVYEPGVTDASGQGSGIEAWIGYSAVDNDPTDPANASDWTWVTASYNTDSGNNDEYSVDLENAIGSPGTYYYASRFRLNGGPFKYGGYNSSGGGFWDSPYSGSGSNKSGKLTIDVVDWCNLQHPENGNISAPGNSFMVYAQIYEDGLTNADANNPGAGIQAWIGYSTVDNDPSDPANASDWTWVAATYNVDSGNNDEFKADLGAQISSGGTYYYASRFQINGGPYAYGGYNGGFWENTYGSGGSNKSGQLTVNDIYITNIIHSPSPVHSWETVSVSADVTADAGVGGVELHWGTTSGNLNNTINMSLSAGNTYVTDSDIPAQADGTTVYYEIYVLDNNAEEKTSAEQSYTVNDAACASELIISEYVEGNSNNKYLELYNGTGSTIDLSNYELRQYNNGDNSPTYTLSLSGSLPHGSTYVIEKSGESLNVNADLSTTSNVMNFNGDDAIELYNTATGQSVDIIGKIGVTGPWGSGSTSTENHTLVRKSSVTAGDTNGSDAFDPAVEWDGYGIDDVSHLGSHTMNCGACSEPTTDATFHADSPQNITTTSLTLNWTNGDGDNRIVVMREGSPVSFVPTDGNTYTANSDYSVATDVSGNGEYVVYNGNGSTVDITGLTPGTLYYATIYEYNCSPGSEDYYTSGTPATDSFYTTPETPDAFSSGCIGETSIDLSWSAPASGNYDGYLVVAREGATPHSVNSLDPNANLGENSDYSAAPTYGSTTPYSRILYKGTGTSVSITGLTNGTSYTFEVFAYSANGTLYRYSDGTQLTKTIELNDVSGTYATGANQQAEVTWVNPATGCYDEILVVANETAGIDFTPSGDGSAYTANTVYSGPNQVVYKGTGTDVTVTNLTNETTYYFEIFVRQGTDWSGGVEVSAVPQDITILEPGDLAILAVNTDIDNQPGSTGDGSGDQIAFVCFKDIKPGTKIVLTDNGYEREVAGKWGNTEGVIAITRQNSILPKGTIIVLETNDQTTGNIKSADHFDVYTCGSIDNNWQKEFIAGQGGFNLNNDDDVWIMQGGVWNNGTAGNHDATYNGNVLYGWTESGWDDGVGDGTNGTKWSNLYPFSKCFTTVAPSGGGKVKFNGDFSVTTNDKLDWIALINDESNWDTYSTNADYDSGGYDYKNNDSCPAMTIATSTHSAGLWKGTNNTNWFDCSNWDNLTVPGENTDVTISGSASNQVIVDASAADANLYSQMAKTNNLTIENGLWLEVNSDNDKLEVHGNLTIESGALLDLSDGDNTTTSDGHLYLYGNWNNQEGSGGLDGGNGTVHFVGSAPQTITTADPSGDETFPNVDLQNDFDLSVSGNLVMTGNLSVASGKTLDISDDHYLKIDGNITNNGSIIVRNHGDLVQTDDNSNISGSGTFRMDKTSLPLNHYYDYVYWSSPINSNALTLGSILSNAWRYYAFDPSLQVPGQNPNPGWVARTASDVFVVGNGVAISAPVGYSGGSLDVSFQHANDPFNNGQIDVTVTVNGTGGQDNDDWNLLGNPYPSALDFDLFATDNTNVQGSYYAWTNCAGLDAQGHHQQAGYTSYAAGAGGTAACSGLGQTLGRYVPSGLGFMIEATSSGTVSFHNSHRSAGHNDYFINRGLPLNRIWIDLQAENEGIYSQNLVAFINGATNNRDRLYDARHMLTGSAYLYTWSDDSVRCVIQGRQAWDGSTRYVQAGIFSTADRPMLLRINRAEGVLDSIPVFVEDHLLQTVHDLRSGPYRFTAYAGDDPSRFTFIFGQRSLKAGNAMADEIMVGGRNGLFRIRSPYPLAGVKIFDMSGRELGQVNAASEHEMLLDLRSIPSQALLLRICLDDGRVLDRKVLR